MKYLEIKNNQGYYYNDKKMVEIDKINKDDLLRLISHAEGENFEMDKYDEDQLKNEAHRIIYQNIYEKFSEFLLHREQFDREVDRLYARAIGEYNADVGEESDEEDIEGVEESGGEGQSLKDIPF